MLEENFIVLLKGVKCQSDETSVAKDDSNSIRPIKLCSRANEELVLCPARCPFKTCGIDDTLIDCIPGPVLGDPDCPPNACQCKNGFFRDNKGECVRWEECPKCTNPNEEYDPCDNPCPIKNCDFDATVVKCKAPPKLGDPECIARCRCKDGFLRNAKGICIPKDKCPCNGDENATRGCGSNCGKLCSDVGRQSPGICPLFCLLNGCECKKGYYYDSNLKKCVLPRQCTPVCKQNEVYSTCANGGCRRRKCSDVGILCIDPVKCKGGCICKKGYVQDANGVCISEDQCKNVSCGGDPNAQPGCGVNCGKKCSDVGLTGPFACPKICKIDGCDCKDGFYLDSSSGKCVRANECKTCNGDPNAEPGCGLNCDRKCSDIGRPIPQACPSACRLDGCDCKNGFYFDDTKGRCVPANQCTPVCRANEVVSNCANGGCRRRKCTDLDKPILCIDPIECVPGCICASGYYQDPDGRCISEAECRNSTTVCKANEVLSSCANGGCRKRKCEDVDGPILCIDPIECKSGCICAEGYYQDSNGRCISEAECRATLPCEGDVNAVPGCGNNCGKRCSDLARSSNTPPICTAECRLNGCDCRDGYYYDDNRKRCVIPNECTPACRANEVLSDCANGGCRRRRCSDPGVVCIDPKMCLPGCICVDGYVLDQNGICVAESQSTCPRANQTYDPRCATAGCRRRKCTDLNVNIQLLCRPVFLCLPGCRCADGFLLNDKGNCVLETDCGVKVSCGGDDNAEPGCGSYCDTQCTDIGRLDTERSQCRDFCTLDGCDCKPGLFYDANIRKCVIPEACSVRGGCAASNSEQLTLLRKGNYRLTSNIFYQMAFKNPGVNFAVSAFSLIFPLVYLFLFSSGETFMRLTYHMNLRGKQQIRCAFPIFLESLKPGQGLQLDIASKIYVQDRYQLTAAFKNDLANFKAEAQTINFRQASNAANTINSWVSGATNGKITDLVSENSFDDSTRLVLANAVYFKGTWKTPFNKDKTEKADFYSNAQRTTKVDMMRLQSKFNYNDNQEIEAKVLEMPYTGGDASFVVMLPNNKDGIVSLTEKLTNAQVLERSASTFNYATVDVSLPKFEITTKIDLKEILSSFGLDPLFTDDAQLSAFEVGVTSVTIPLTFTADHPFVYCIKFKTMLLFCGVHYG
ncbi:hypothetical protein ACJJTC_019623 [Scirpophaga incertulas]